jgi:hypothetical protein
MKYLANFAAASVAAAVAACTAAVWAVEAPSLGVKITRVEFADASPEAAEVDVYVQAESQRAVSVRSFSFHRWQANTMPAYIKPELERTDVPANQPLELGPFRVAFYFRDLNSLEPLRLMVEQSSVRIEGQARVEIALDWIARLAMWSSRGVIWFPIDQSLEVYIPGGVLGQTSAQAALALAEPVVRAGASLRRARREARVSAWDEASPRLAMVRTSFRIQAEGEQPVSRETVGTGVILSPWSIIIPREILEPWLFDPAMAFALENGALALLPEREIEVILPEMTGWPQQSFRASRSELRLLSEKCRQERVLLFDQKGKARRVRVCRSSGEAALARLELTAEVNRPYLPWLFARLAHDQTMELAALRLLNEPDFRGRWWEIVSLPAKQQGAEIRLLEPIDRSAAGSPLLLDGALVGVLQQEGGGISLSDAQGQSGNGRGEK